MLPVWDELSTAPPVLSGPPKRVDVLVVGAGVVGLATAYACRRRGLSVAVAERADRIAPASSGRAGGLLVPRLLALEHPEVADLAAQSCALWRAWDDELGHTPGVRRMDWMAMLPFAPPEGSAPPPGMQVLDADAARTVEPALGDVLGVLRIEDQGQVDPLAACRALASAVDVHLGVDVRPDAVHAGVTVWCTGLAPMPVEQSWVKGHLLATAPVPFRLSHGLSAPDALVVQLADGRLVCGGTLDDGDDTTVDDTVVARIRDAVGTVLPQSRDVPTTHAWACLRPRGASDLPVVHRIDEWTFATWGHFRNGITFAPAIGSAIASWIATGEQPALIAPFAHPS
ncbi:MAG TPA: FAD-dependent oxidoreductase [Mycobacteriales bacterium]|nr:FAD-dependent oxidoreductase [Mycobacteriales bacterium]